MKAVDVFPSDTMVVDRDGAVWVYSDKRWHYLTDKGLSVALAEYDLPESCEPYIRLSANAQSILVKGISLVEWREVDNGE